MRILVVDDDPRIRAALAEPLKAAGYEVSDAADGEDALSMLETAPPDLLILDVTLPGIAIAAAWCLAPLRIACSVFFRWH